MISYKDDEFEATTYCINPKGKERIVLQRFEDLIKDREISSDTLLYGIDAKFYEPEIRTNEHFETKQKGLYVLGDCSGTTYSLAQAASSGVYLGRYLLKSRKNVLS